MKVLLLTVFVIALSQVKSLTDKQKELLVQHYKQCIESSEVDPTILQKARNGDFSDDPKLKDHILCIIQKIGFQNAAGELQKDVIERKLNEAVKGDVNKAKQLIEACAVSNADPKIQAFNAFKCIYEKSNINLL